MQLEGRNNEENADSVVYFSIIIVVYFSITIYNIATSLPIPNNIEHQHFQEWTLFSTIQLPLYNQSGFQYLVHTYIAEISDKDSIELLRGLSRYNLIDEMVVYILPVIAGKGTPVFDDLTPSRWNIHKTTSFSNGITRIIYRNSCILQ